MVTRWQQFNLVHDCESVPRRGGVYAIYDFAGDLIYIGSSGNVRTRVVEHRRKARWRVWMAKISFMEGNWYRREQRLIRRLLPPGNRRLTYNHFYLTK
jgi:excinuclease UvrABC nuclease subunit